VSVETDLKRIYRLGTRREKKNRNFLKWLKYRCTWSDRRLMKLQKETVARVWSQIDCTQCGNCCAEMQLQVTEKDISALAKTLGIKPREFREQYAEKHRDGHWYMKDTPCFFLERRRCIIYESRPSRCRGFPYLHNNIRGDISGAMDRAPYCPIVFNVLEELKANTELRPARRTKR
jgi:Fe-S-cluster containining protein